MNYNARRMLTPGASRKRKEREAFYSFKPPAPFLPLSASAQAAAKKQQSVSKPKEPASSNRILAGYMAHEFLTKGTLFGQKFAPARAEAVPMGGGGAGEWKSLKPGVGKEPSLKKEHQSYTEVASIRRAMGPTFRRLLTRRNWLGGFRCDIADGAVIVYVRM